MSDLSAYGIRVTVPRGWDARISRRRPHERQRGTPLQVTDGGVEHAVLHVASFQLPAGCGDFGSGAVEQMVPGDVLLCLIEFGDEEAGSALYSRVGVPHVRQRGFSPDSMQRTIPGMSGAQAFFTESGRAFCAFTVIGSHSARASLVPRIDAVMRTIQISPR